MIHYNCNELNKEYYDNFETELAKIYKEQTEDVEYIPIVLKNMGYNILLNDCNREGYCGELYIIYEKDNKIYLFESAYGSCSVCDIWYDATYSINDFLDIFKDEDRSTVMFDDGDDIKYFIENHTLYSDCVKDKLLELSKAPLN